MIKLKFLHGFVEIAAVGVFLISFSSYAGKDSKGTGNTEKFYEGEGIMGFTLGMKRETSFA